MSNTNELKSFINLVINENLSQAKDILANQLNEKLTDTLKSKFEVYAPSIFEAKNAKPDFLDLDKDGNTSEPMKQAAAQAEEGDTEEDDETESEESDEEEEESSSEDEEGEEDEEDYEEDEETEQENN
jgi:hypothetical protein